MADLKVTFPEPCSEPWDGMSEVGCNRHCASCDRIVHDLRELTADEAEALLDGEERVCVLAEVRRDGTVLTRQSARAIIVGAGAMLVVGCQTAPGGEIEGGYHLSGQIDGFSERQHARIKHEDGDEVALRVGMDGRFDVRGLRPGTYTVTFNDYCGDRQEVSDIVVVDSDVELGRLDYEPSCIIIGHMRREPETRRG